MVVSVLVDGENVTGGLYVLVAVLIDGEHDTEVLYVWLFQA